MESNGNSQRQEYWCWDSRKVTPQDPCPYCNTGTLYPERSGPRLLPTLWCTQCEQIVAVGHPLRRQAGTGREGREMALLICEACNEPVRVKQWFVQKNVVVFYVCCSCGGISQCMMLMSELKDIQFL